MTEKGKGSVGYRRPPAHTRFVKGQSGNPKGRPKGLRNVAHDLTEIMSERVTINEGGKARRVDKQRLILMAMVAKGAKGDTRAAAYITDLARQVEAQREAGRAEQRMSAEDDAILDRFVAAQEERLMPARQTKLKRRRTK